MSIEDFINDIQQKDFTSAQSTFHELMQQRMQDALDQQKIVVAGQMFGEPEDEAEDVSDEDMEDAFDDDQEEFDFEGEEDNSEEVEDEVDSEEDEE